VVFSGDTFGSRVNPRNGRIQHDNYVYSWPHEYRRVLSAFMDAQLRGKRVLIVSGDCHSLRIDQHPDPEGRAEAAGIRITEFTCAGIRCELWSGAAPGDPNVDRARYRLNVSGAGLIEIDPPGAAVRTVTLRAIDATAGRPWTPGSRWCCRSSRPERYAPVRTPCTKCSSGTVSSSPDRCASSKNRTSPCRSRGPKW
jgi:hypothetical protein